MGPVGIVGCLRTQVERYTEQFRSLFSHPYKKNMKLASRRSVFTLLVVVMTVFGFTKANPLPQSIDDYGDYDNSKNLERRQGKEDDKLIPVGDADQVDPIGDIFGDILGGVGALLTEGIKIVTDVTDGSKNATEVVGDALKVGTDATQEVAKIGVKALGAAPSILQQKVAFAQGFAKTVQESSGQVKQSVDGLNQQLKVASAFAKTYGEVAVEGLTKFLEDFGRRLRCNTECKRHKEGSEERQQCETENCIELAQIRTAEEMEEEYDYSYGYDDTEEEEKDP